MDREKMKNTTMKKNKEDKEWLDYQKKFAKEYDNLNYSSALQKWVMNQSHKILEKKFSSAVHFEKVLEIGAGTGEHFAHIHHTFGTYTMLDHNLSTLMVAKKKINANLYEKVIFKVHKGGALPYKNNSLDRVIATHVLEHIPNPHLAIKEWMRVLKPNGVLSIIIPSDPGFAWRMARFFGPRRRALKKGISYDYIMAREHINSSNNLIILLKHYAKNYSEKWWPFFLPSIDINLFYAFNAYIDKPI